MTRPEGYTWGQKRGVKGRRLHIVDWDASFDFGVGCVAKCGLDIYRSNWTDHDWAEQDREKPANPARPCPECVKLVRDGDH